MLGTPLGQVEIYQDFHLMFCRPFALNDKTTKIINFILRFSKWKCEQWTV